MPIARKQAVAQEAPVLTTDSAPKLIREPVRFAFHTVGISAAGVLAALLGEVLAGGAALVLVVVCVIGEALRASKKATEWPSWTIIAPLARAAHRVEVRDHEKGTRTATLDFALALLIIWGTCPLQVVVVACFITAWCDPLARVVGQNWGKHKLPFGKKSYEGSATCWFIASVVAFVGLSISIGVSLPVLLGALLVGVCTTLAELIPQWCFKTRLGTVITPADNFWLVLISGLSLALTLGAIIV